MCLPSYEGEIMSLRKMFYWSCLCVPNNERKENIHNVPLKRLRNKDISNLTSLFKLIEVYIDYFPAYIQQH
uniref:Uncharacterized protein n=1 Tax=Onchocerca volvulus TaxID=6282 RepID=A0A8R1TJL4_ONCVO